MWELVSAASVWGARSSRSVGSGRDEGAACGRCPDSVRGAAEAGLLALVPTGGFPAIVVGLAPAAGAPVLFEDSLVAAFLGVDDGAPSLCAARYAA